MRKWILILLIALLAACGGDDNNDEPDVSEPTATLDENATEEALQIDPQDIPGQQMNPGARGSDGLEIVGSRTFTSDFGVGWVVVELQNTNANPIEQAEVAVSLLDSQNRERLTVSGTTPFWNIPPDVIIPLSIEFSLPPDYSDFLAIAEIANEGSGFEDLVAQFGLPNTVDPIEGSGYPLTVRGTITNDRGVPLAFPVVTLAFYDENGQILGASNARLIEGLTELRELPIDGTATFEATVLYLPSAIAEVRVVAAGYQR